MNRGRGKQMGKVIPILVERWLVVMPSSLNIINSFLLGFVWFEGKWRRGEGKRRVLLNVSYFVQTKISIYLM